jgi:hypothetical protein
MQPFEERFRHGAIHGAEAVGYASNGIAAHQLGGRDQCEQVQAAVPRAMELQSFAIKRLIDAAFELAKRLEPVMGPDMANKANGQVARDKAGCLLAETIANHAVEIDGATDVLRDILRRLAL